MIRKDESRDRSLLEKGLSFDLIFSCGPKELEALKQVPLKWLIQTSCNSYQETLRSLRISSLFFEEFEKSELHTFYDVLHAGPRLFVECLRRAYTPILLKKGYKPKDIPRHVKDSVILQRVGDYLCRYRLRLGHYHKANR